MAKKKKYQGSGLNSSWGVKDLLEAYGVEAVKAGARYINESATRLQDEAKANIDRMGIGENTEYYDDRYVEKNGKTYKSKRYYVSTGELKRVTRAIPINIDGITEKSTAISAGVINDAVNPKNGVAYGRIIEFGKHPKPFFYKAFYDNRANIKDTLLKVIREAWVRSGKK